MGERRTRILFAGDSLDQTTGMSYVMSQLMKRFAKLDRFDIAYCCISGKDTTPGGLGAQGQDFAEACKGMPIWNAQLADQNKYKNFDQAVMAFKPETVIAIHDPWMMDHIIYSPRRESFYLVAYLTIETPEYPEFVLSPNAVLPQYRKSLKDALSRIDTIIPYTDMGKKALERLEAKPTESCYSGVDLTERVIKEVPKPFAFGESCKEDDFVFMSMGMNTERKKLDRVVEAYYKFYLKMNKNPKYKLYLHTDMETPLGGSDIKGMIMDLGIQDLVLIPSMMRVGAGIDRVQLYERYQACDAYIGLPAGEGFGYGFAEALLHGKPVIYIDYGGHVGYCKNCGLSVKIGDFYQARNANIKWALANTDDAAKQMARIASDAKLRESLGARGIKVAETELDWEKNFLKFVAIIDRERGPHMKDRLNGFGLRRVV